MERSIAREYSYFCKKETDEHMSQDEDVDKKENEEDMCLSSAQWGKRC
jgi:hypothetical protein